MIQDPAPDFRLKRADGQWVSLADYAGSKLVLFFYPAALTPGCTVEAIDFTTARDTFSSAGYAIAGISPDDPETLTKFMTQNNLDIALLSDPELETIKAYGAWGDRTLYGKVITGVIRSTLLIDVGSDGTGQVLEAQYGVRATGHVKRLLGSLDLE